MQKIFAPYRKKFTKENNKNIIQLIGHTHTKNLII